MMGAFAQAESESMSQNIRWGKRQAMREGRAYLNYSNLYAYEKGPDGRPQVIPEQAEVVRRIYNSFLAGQNLRMIQAWLEDEKIPSVWGGTAWTISSIRGILTNEKYCGDVLQQKTFISDCIERRSIRNTGQLPMYLIQDHHEGIVSRETFHAVKAEFARRNAGKAPSRNKAPTGRSCYSAKYALTGRLVCGECGTAYRRCAWTKRGKKRVVWRCASRVDYGSRYCKDSPTMDEKPLQEAILAAINLAMSRKEELIAQIEDSMGLELALIPGETMSVSDMDRRISELEQEFRKLFAASREEGGYLGHADAFKRITLDMAALKEQRAALLLRDVRYVIEAHFEMTDQAAQGDNPGKFQDIVKRRIKRGQFYHQPCFGCREFPAQFRWCEEFPPCPDELKDRTQDLGWMLYDMDYTDPENIRPLFFRGSLQHGVLNVPDRNSGEVRG